MELFHVGLELSKKLMAKDCAEFARFFMTNEDVNIVGKLLQCLTVDASALFSRTQMYREAVEMLSRILIKASTTANSNVVPKFLVKQLLQCDNILLGYVVIDLWSAWIRCLSGVQCLDLIAFLSEINRKLVQPNHLQWVHVAVALRSLYDNLTSSHKLQLRAKKPIATNIELWTALGFQRIPDNGTNAIMDGNIDALCREFLAERNGSTLEKLVSDRHTDEPIVCTHRTIVSDRTSPLTGNDATTQQSGTELSHRTVELKLPPATAQIFAVDRYTHPNFHCVPAAAQQQSTFTNSAKIDSNRRYVAGDRCAEVGNVELLASHSNQIL